MPNYNVVKFIKREKIAQDTFTFTFNKPENFNFVPGQFTRINLNISSIPSYFFTISSSPLDQIIEITTKTKNLSPFKKALLKLEKGEKIMLENAQGEFKFDKKIPTQVLLCGGIGITPFYSMLTYAHQLKLKNNIFLFASFSNVPEVIFYNKLAKIAKELINFKVIFTVSSPNKEWVGESGRITNVLLNKYIQSLYINKYMIVGPASMVIDLEKTVNNIAKNDSEVQIETFLGY